MAGRGIVGNQMLAVKTEDADIVLAVQHNHLVGTELDGSNGRSSRSIESHADSLLAIDVDCAGAKGRFIGADREERLNRVIGHNGDLGIDTIAGKL